MFLEWCELVNKKKKKLSNNTHHFDLCSYCMFDTKHKNSKFNFKIVKSILNGFLITHGLLII